GSCGKMTGPVDETARRGNYESGSDYVLEYGELRFAFNERDFAQRVEQAAVKLDFVRQGLDEHELEDLLELAGDGEIHEPCSPRGDDVNENWDDLVGPSNKSLVRWLRRLVFRGAWLDQRVKEGELDIVFDESTQTFGYVQPDRDSELIELSAEPSWGSIAYGGRHRAQRAPPAHRAEGPGEDAVRGQGRGEAICLFCHVGAHDGPQVLDQLQVAAVELAVVALGHAVGVGALNPPLAFRTAEHDVPQPVAALVPVHRLHER